MLIRTGLLLILLGLFGAESRAQQRQGDTADSLTTAQQVMLVEMLDASFQSLAHEDRRGRQIGGYVLLGLGIGAGVGGAATLVFGEGDDARIVGYSLMGGGALLSGLSLLPFKLKAESERLYDEFSQAPRGSPDQIQNTFLYWDQRFGEFAEKSRRSRVVGGVTSIVIGGVTGLVVLSGSSQDRLEASIWTALGPVMGGVSSLLIKSEAERRYETYRRAKEGIVGRVEHATFRAGIAPLPGGGLVVVQVQF